jgi:hypothetical protein
VLSPKPFCFRAAASDTFHIEGYVLQRFFSGLKRKHKELSCDIGFLWPDYVIIGEQAHRSSVKNS